MIVPRMGDGLVKSTPMAVVGTILLAVPACGFAISFGLESRAARIERLLRSPAADSIAGRAAGTLGSTRAA